MKIFLKKKKTKREKKLEKYIKILLRKKKKKGISIIRSVSKSCRRNYRIELSIEEIIITHRKQLLGQFLDF